MSRFADRWIDWFPIAERLPGTALTVGLGSAVIPLTILFWATYLVAAGSTLGPMAHGLARSADLAIASR